MRQLLAIARRETGAFFHGAMGPVVLTGFLLAVGLFFVIFLLGYSDLSLTALQSPRSGNIVNLAEGLFRPLVSDMTLFLLLLMPAITMRLFAPEYSSGRYNLIAAWPVADHIWVLGKWLAAMASALVLILASSAYFGVVWFLGKPEFGPIVAAFTGLLLLASCLAGWGLLASVLFTHQMVAYFLAFAITFTLFIVGSLERFLPGIFGQICRELSFLSHFERFSRGVLDSRDVLFFLLMTMVPLLAANAALGSRRLPRARRLAWWSPSLIGILLAVVVYVTGLYLPWSADLTGNRRYSLAPQTLQVLDSLPADLAALRARPDSTAAILGPREHLDHVQVYAFYQRLDPGRDPMEVLLKACSQRTNAFRYEVVDPEAELELVRRYGVNVSRTVVVEVGEVHISVLQPEESGLINAVYRMVTGKRPVICHLLGHGEHLLDSDERSGYSSFERALFDQGYDTVPLHLAEVLKVPDACDVAVLAGPRTDPDPLELEALDAYLARGGSVLALFDPPTPGAWVQWMDRYRVGLSGDVLVSADRAGELYGVGARTTVIVDGYGDHEISRTLRGMSTVFPLAQPLGEAGEPDERIVGAVLLASSNLSWGEHDPDTRFSGKASFDPGVDPAGPLALGMVLEASLGAEGEAPGRLVVFGNSEFLNNSNLNLGGNRDLLLNSLGWLAREETLIEIRGRDPLSQPVVLSTTQKRVFGWGAVLGWPLLVGSLALGWMLRSRREAGPTP